MNVPQSIADTAQPLTTEPVRLDKQVYLSPEFARAERDGLWMKVWQAACREEELREAGDYVTYDISDQSLVVLRDAQGDLMAYHNVCQHRGRRLVEGEGCVERFTCPYHGWKWGLDGRNQEVTDEVDWDGAIDRDTLKLRRVKLGTWGGWVFINLDPDCEPLADYIAPVAALLDPFELDRMRYRWRQWLHLPCNWKVALEAFMEGYHLSITHPQRNRFSPKRSTWSRGYGPHGVFGSRNQQGFGGATGGFAGSADQRVAAAESIADLWETVYAMTTQTVLDVALSLPQVLPEDTPPAEVMRYLMETSRQVDADRGIDWPEVDPQHLRNAGVGWTIFPNTLVLHGLTYALCYRARPHGFDPDSCIFEVYVIERFPEGEEPQVKNLHKPEMTEESWRKTLMQDFNNLPQIQLGMKSEGYPGPLPNPWQEGAIINFHRALAEYVGYGGPRPYPERAA